jgi:hypothetical protein
MTTHYTQLEVEIYFDDANNQTCALHFPDKVCKFYMTIGMRAIETCYFADHENGETLVRRGHCENGTLIPCKNCPLWGNGK